LASDGKSLFKYSQVAGL